MASSKAMRRISLRSIAAHKVRLGLTILAVVLGTAFVAGSFMFTASLSKSFDGIVQDSLSSVDAVITPKDGQGAVLPPGTLEKISSNPAVGKVNVSGETTVVVADENRHALSTGGAPTQVSPYYEPDETVGKPVPIVQGASPKKPDEVVVNDAAAKAHGISAGDKLLIVDPMGKRSVTVSGVYSTNVNGGGYIGIGMMPEAYLKNYAQGGMVSRLYVSAKPGTDQPQLLEALRKDCPEAKVRTGPEVSEELSGKITKALSFINYFLIAFGLVGLLVGTFIIANTFSMIVAQRMREFALLRALGVSRGQLTTSVVFEAIVIGLLGSLLGVLAGVGLVRLIYAGMEAFGAGLPVGGVGITPASIIVPLLLGLLVTVVSAWAPARRAGAVRPVEAMRSGDASSASPLKLRSLMGALAVALGVACALFGVWLDAKTAPRASLVGVGAVLLILGVFLVSPAISIPVVPTIGRVVGPPSGGWGDWRPQIPDATPGVPQRPPSPSPWGWRW
ncbi:Macrolide export ATP-binding/permease protein MacB [Corynebacterium heidelbergense]|nr:Macrolide export ATP-binding/permease protein MacB [Corynebacterium heidelbergense]